MDNGNRKVYDSARAGRYYSGTMQVLPPENTIFSLLGSWLSTAVMLDIGIGAGRTTRHLLSRVKSYCGIDYSETMVSLCRNRFGTSEKQSFEVMDARSLSMADDTFDFVLFSYNGIDSIDHEGRVKALAEMRRVCKPEGFCCISSHNIEHFHNRIRFAGKSLTGFADSLLCRIMNPHVRPGGIRRGSNSIVRDGAQRFRLQLYYSDYFLQVRQLKESGFSTIRSYSTDGHEIISVDDPALKTDPWIHYLIQ